MRMAVFTDEYPARSTGGFERDMRALLAAGFDLDIFATGPLDPERWVDSTGLLDAGRGGRVLVHHLRRRELFHWAPALLFHQPARCLADTGTILPGVARSGPVSLTRTAAALPRAWVWAAQQADWYGHVLAYWGVHAGSCAYAFHRLQSRLTPFTLWLHDGVDVGRQPGLLRRTLRYADNVITCSEFDRENILRRFADLGFRLGRKLHVLHHGLDLAELPYDPEWRPEARILAVGRLAAGMGHEGLVRAAQLLSARGGEVTLEIVGDGSELGRLRALTADLGIAGRTHFRGRLSAEETRRAIAAATVLVDPSDAPEHGLPEVVPEAMALGTPVVACRVAGLPYALEDGCGVLVPPRDPEALIRAIGSLLSDPLARREVVERARRRVQERFDDRRSVALLVRLLRDTRRRTARVPAALAGVATAREVSA